MTTSAIHSALTAYRELLTDSLASELSRAQRETDAHSLKIVTEAQATVQMLEGEWNAAIEAAAERASDEAFATNEVTWSVAQRIRDAVRALKREAK